MSSFNTSGLEKGSKGHESMGFGDGIQSIIYYFVVVFNLIFRTSFKLSIVAVNEYSSTSLSRTRLFRITAYLEVKIWSLF